MVLALSMCGLIAFAKGQTILVFAADLILCLSLGALAHLVFKERWVFKNTHFRFVAFAIFALFWSKEHPLYELLIWSLLLASQWQFVEHFSHRKNSVWLLHNATVSAAVLIAYGGGGWLFAALSLLMMLRSSILRPLHVVRWAVGFSVPVIAVRAVALPLGWEFDYSLPIVFHFKWQEIITYALLFVATIGQMTASFRRANLTNKSRSVVAFMIILLSFLAYGLGFGSIALASIIFALSFQVCNALYYLPSKWYYEVIALLVAGLAVFQLFEVLPWL